METSEATFFTPAKASTIGPLFDVCIFVIKLMAALAVSFLLLEVSALRGHISHVVLMGSNKQVLRVDALSIVALVAYAKLPDFIRDKDQIGSAVSCRVNPINEKSPISIWQQCPSPVMTVGAVYE